MRLQISERRLVLVGSLFSLAAAMSYGTSQVVARRIVVDYAPALVGSSFALFFGMVVLGLLVHPHVATDLRRAPKRAWLFVALAGLASSWGVTFMFLALSKAPVVQVSPIAGLNPLVALVLTHLFLQRLERVTLRIVMGALLVVGGVTLITIGNSL